jgi:hypothetical protein
MVVAERHEHDVARFKDHLVRPISQSGVNLSAYDGVEDPLGGSAGFNSPRR